MLRRYTFDQAAEKLALDATEIKFLVHHFRDFLSSPPTGQANRSLTDQDVVLLMRAYKLMHVEGYDPTNIRLIFREEGTGQKMSGRRQAEILAFVSGRPGSGKSSLIYNLASSMVARGYRCTIFDGATDSCGISDLLPPDSRGEGWFTVLESGARLIQGERCLDAENAMGTEELYNQLQDIDAASDFILVDTGQGRSDNALRFAMIVDETIAITTPDVGANADCFSVVRMLRDVDPDLRVGLVLNRALGLGDARESFARINGAAQKVGLGELNGLGWVAEDEALRKCMATGESVVETLPTSISARCIARLADHLSNRLTPVQRRSSGGLITLAQALRSAMRRGDQPSVVF